MAVFTIEIFARAPEDAAVERVPADALVEAQFREALAPLTTSLARALAVLTLAITPYGGAAMVEALCVGASSEDATEAIAARLHAAMQDTPVFDGWHLHAGHTHVHMSDN